MALRTGEAQTRRGLVAGTLGGLAAAVGTALGRPVPAGARGTNDPNAVHKNVNNPTTASTSVTCNGATSIRAISNGGGTTKSGVFAQANGTNSRGVTGLGVTGVLGQSNGSAGRGVTGFVPGANATAVFGDATSTTASGAPTGTFGRTTAPNGIGARGQNLATTGEAFGVFGSTFSPSGAGVRGEHVPTTGNGAGVSGISESPAGRAVEGLSTATSGSAAGVFGESRAPDGQGIRGVHEPSSGGGTGAGAGVKGETTSAEAAGVFGRALGTTGGAGVLGSASNPDAFGGLFQAAGDAVALSASGPVEFSSAGRATIQSGSTSVVVNPGVAIDPVTKILCTLMSDPGGTTTLRHVTKNNAANTFEVNLSAAATANTSVAYFVIS
jgi:hypothetical protein